MPGGAGTLTREVSRSVVQLPCRQTIASSPRDWSGSPLFPVVVWVGEPGYRDPRRVRHAGALASHLGRR